MTDPTPSFFTRVSLAFGSFFSTLSNPGYAARVQGLREPDKAAPPAPPQPASIDAALQLLALLQRDARLIDFVQEDLAGYSDAEIGGPARLVHEGCAKVLRKHFTLVPVRPEAEGSPVTLAAGFDARAIRLTGNVVGQAPFRGSLSHCGWRATDVRLPTLAAGHDAAVLAPAEVEL